MKGMTISVDPSVMQRGVADILEKKVCKILIDRLNKKKDIHAKDASTKRSIEDMIVETQNETFYVDVKTADQGGTFSMPNLISVDRLHKLYQDPSKTIMLIFVDYEWIDDATIAILDIRQSRIEEIDMESLHVQNLGKGQLQLRNGTVIRADPTVTRGIWMNDFINMVIAFKKQLLEKTQKDLEMWSSLQT
jgi:hypothetical protein